MKPLYKLSTIFISLLFISACSPVTSDSSSEEKSSSSSRQQSSSEVESSADPNSVLYRAHSLVKNINKLASTSEVFGIEKKSSRSSNVIRRAGMIDETEPSDMVVNFPPLKGYFQDTWDSIDQTIEVLKTTKDFVITHINCFDTWVNPAMPNLYKLSYDANSDTAIIYIRDSVQVPFTIHDKEYLPSSLRYVSSSYNEEGKIIINYHLMRYYEANDETLLSLDCSISYEEGRYWNYTSHYIDYSLTDPDDVFDFIDVIHAQIDEDNKEISQLGYATLYEDKTFNVVKQKPMPTEFIHLNSDNLVTVYREEGQGEYVFNKEGYNYLHSNISVGTNFSIPLYRLTGYDKIENHYDDTYLSGNRYLYIGNNVYTSDVFYPYAGGTWCTTNLPTSQSSEPGLAINIPNADTPEEAEAFIKGLLESIGLSLKEDYLLEALTNVYNKDQHVNNREAFSRKGLYNISVEDIDNIYDRYKFSHITKELIDEEEKKTAIEFNEQQMDNTLYGLVEVSNNNPSFTIDNDNKVINIDQCTLNVTKNAFLSTERDYKGVVALKTSNELIPISTSEAVRFDGINDFEVTIPSSSLELANYPEIYDKCIIVCYLAHVDNEDLLRVSGASKLNYAGNSLDILLSEENTIIPTEEYYSISKTTTRGVKVDKEENKYSISYYENITKERIDNNA